MLHFGDSFPPVAQAHLMTSDGDDWLKETCPTYRNHTLLRSVSSDRLVAVPIFSLMNSDEKIPPWFYVKYI